MIKICMQGEWLLLDEYQNYFIEVDEEGNQSMQFEIPLSVLYGGYTVETQVEDAYGRWLIKKINQLNKSAVIICEPDLDDWKTGFYLDSSQDPHLQSKTIVEALTYLKPRDWRIVCQGTFINRKTLALEKCTAYELLMEAKSLYDVQYDIDTLHKMVRVVDPYEVIDSGVYITPELNQKSFNFKGDSSQLVTRLYCYGADEMTFADINEGKPYIEDFTFSDRVISAYWSDTHYTNMEDLLVAGRKKLKELGQPKVSYTVEVVDLQAMDDTYRNLELRLREVVHCIVDTQRNMELVQRIVKKKFYPNQPAANVITLSNQPRVIEQVWEGLREEVRSTKKDGYRYETQISQTTKEINTIVKKTDENTKNLQAVEQKISPEQLLISVSESIKAGNQLDAMQVMIDLFGLTITNGGIKVYDGENELVMYVDEKTKKLVFKGDIHGSNISTDKDLVIGNRLIIGEQEDNGFRNYKSIDFSNTAHILGTRDGVEYCQLLLNAMDNVTMSTGLLEGGQDFFASVSVLYNTASMAASYRASIRAPIIEMNVNPTITSDQRMKSDIHEIDTAWIDDLHIVGFHYQEDPHKQIGLVAQTCLENPYADYFIDQNDEGFYSIRYGNILNALIKYCQDLQKRLNKMEAEMYGNHSHND